MEDLNFLATCIVGCVDLPEKYRRFLLSLLDGLPTPYSVVKEAAGKLPTLSQALSIIAQRIGAKSIFEREVVEMYFLSTENNLPPSTAREILKAIGVKEETITLVPRSLEIKPLHNCIVFLSAFPVFSEAINLCSVRPAVATARITENAVKLRTIFVAQKGEEFCLQEREEYARTFVPLEKGDLVAIHYGYVIRRITENENETFCKGLSLIPLLFNKRSS